jgi:hypothetical protein
LSPLAADHAPCIKPQGIPVDAAEEDVICVKAGGFIEKIYSIRSAPFWLNVRFSFEMFCCQGNEFGFCDAFAFNQVLGWRALLHLLSKFPFGLIELNNLTADNVGSYVGDGCLRPSRLMCLLLSF